VVEQDVQVSVTSVIIWKLIELPTAVTTAEDLGEVANTDSLKTLQALRFGELLPSLFSALVMFKASERTQSAPDIPN
jgi:hypothetical protein